MHLRLILPPNIEAAAQRDAIPTKLEIQVDDRQIQAPEKVPMDKLGNLPEAERVAAFLLLQWCNGALGSFLQLSKEQLSTLVANLQGEPLFFWANKPKQAIDWNGRELIGVSEHISLPEPSSSSRPKAAHSSSIGREA
ncbi:MAG: hypothetical protein AAGB46_18870, partial [Verrucomicrobiota bacterium]